MKIILCDYCNKKCIAAYIELFNSQYHVDCYDVYMNGDKGEKEEK